MDEIKEIKKEALEKLGEQENPEPWFSPQKVLDIITEIERMEKEENDCVKCVDEQRRELQKCYAEIKQLEAVREVAEEKIEKLKVVIREVLIISRTPLRKELSEAVNILIDIQKKLRQTLDKQ